MTLTDQRPGQERGKCCHRAVIECDWRNIPITFIDAWARWQQLAPESSEIAYAIGCWAPLIYRAPHNFRYAITNPTAMPTPSAIFATRSLR